MKKTAFTFAVLVFLSLCLMVSASAIIGGTATDVFFTQENVVGDPASAEGFSVQSLFTLDGHAHWDTTLTLGKNPAWNTDFSYTTFSRGTSNPIEPYVDLSAVTDFSIHSYITLDLSEIPGLLPYASVLNKMAQEAPANAEAYTKTMALSDVMDNLPLCLNTYANTLRYPIPGGTSRDDNGFFTRYFHIPAEGYTVQLSVDTNASKELIGAAVTILDAPSIYVPGVITDDALYLAFGAEKTISESAPFGVYRIPFSNSDGSHIFVQEQAELVLPMEGSFLYLCTMENESKLFVLNRCSDGGSQGIFIDTVSGQLLQSIQTPKTIYSEGILVQEDYIALLSGWDAEDYPDPQAVIVWAKGEDGQYHQTVDADFSQASFYHAWPYAVLYDHATGRLLFTAYTSRTAPSLQIAVCQGDKMTYGATFRSSQDRLREAILFQSVEEIPRLYLAQAQ